MIPLIPRASAQYDQSNEQQFRGGVERDAATNQKQGGPFDLKSANGKIWRLTVDNTGALTTTLVS